MEKFKLSLFYFGISLFYKDIPEKNFKKLFIFTAENKRISCLKAVENLFEFFLALVFFVKNDLYDEDQVFHT